MQKGSSKRVGLGKIIKQLQRWLEPSKRISHVFTDGRVFLNPAPAIKCYTGLCLSMQASEYAYCLPSSNEGPWFYVELGFPSKCIDELFEYMDGSDDALQSVYSFVPISLVAKIVVANGGIVNEIAPNNAESY